jgi:hypothetical protein
MVDVKASLYTTHPLAGSRNGILLINLSTQHLTDRCFRLLAENLQLMFDSYEQGNTIPLYPSIRIPSTQQGFALTFFQLNSNQAIIVYKS